MSDKAKYLALLAAWVLSCIGTICSLIASEFYGFTPCPFCWYQRIALFPLVWILGLGAYDLNLQIARYAQGLSIFGLLISAFQLLTFHPYFAKTCSAGCLVSNQHFLIPILSFANFTLINICLILSKKSRLKL